MSLQLPWSPSRCHAWSGQQTSPCERHPCNVFPSYLCSLIASAPSPIAWGPLVLLCKCVSPSGSSLFSGSRTWLHFLLPILTRLGTLAGGDIFMAPPGRQILVRWTKTHQSIGRTPVFPIMEVPGHPKNHVAAYWLLITSFTTMADQPLLTYIHPGHCTMVTVPILS